MSKLLTPDETLPIFPTFATVTKDGKKYKAFFETDWNQVMTEDGKSLHDFLTSSPSITGSNGIIEIYDSKTNKLIWTSANNSNVLTFRGSYESYEALTTAVTSSVIEPKSGDVYSIVTAGGNDANGLEIKANDFLAYGNQKWFIITNTININKTEIIEELKKYIDTIVPRPSEREEV